MRGVEEERNTHIGRVGQIRRPWRGYERRSARVTARGGEDGSRRGGGRVTETGSQKETECDESGIEEENRGKREYQEAEAAA